MYSIKMWTVVTWVVFKAVTSTQNQHWKFPEVRSLFFWSLMSDSCIKDYGIPKGTSMLFTIYFFSINALLFTTSNLLFFTLYYLQFTIPIYHLGFTIYHFQSTFIFTFYHFQFNITWHCTVYRLCFTIYHFQSTCTFISLFFIPFYLLSSI